MAQKVRELKDLRELPPGGDLPQVGQAGRSNMDDEEEKEYKLANADREKIDQIVLSNDVNKGGKIRVSRRGPLDRDFAYITTIPADQWDTETQFEYIKKQFGGGDYKCQTFRSNGQLYKAFEFSIDHRFKGVLDDATIRQIGETAKNGGTIVMPAMPSQDAFKSSDMLKMMEMGNHRSDQMMMMMMTQMQESQKTMASIFAAMLSSANQNKSGGIDPVIIELLKSKQERTPLSELIESMTALKMLNSPDEKEEKEETMFDKLMKFAPALFPMLAGGQQPQAQPQIAAPQPQQPQQPPANPGLIDQLPKEFRIMLVTMIRAAERGSPPDLYADLVIDNTADHPQKWQILKTILTDPLWVAKLFGDESKVAHVRPWLEELRTLLLNYDPAAPNSPEEPAATSSSEIPTQQHGT